MGNGWRDVPERGCILLVQIPHYPDRPLVKGDPVLPAGSATDSGKFTLDAEFARDVGPRLIEALETSNIIDDDPVIGIRDPPVLGNEHHVRHHPPLVVPASSDPLTEPVDVVVRIDALANELHVRATE